MAEKAVVLGHTGLVGMALFEHLRKMMPVAGYNSSTLDLRSPHSADELRALIDRDTVLFVAVQGSSVKDQWNAFPADLTMAFNIARCLARGPVRKCVYFSTLSVYSDVTTNLAISEDTEIAPTSPYGVAKFAAECLLREACRRSATPLVVLRPCKIYGEGDRAHRYGPTTFIEAMLRDEPIRMFGDGTELRDYLFVDDAVRIAGELALSNHEGTFVLGTGHSVSFVDMIASLGRLAGRPLEVVHVRRDGSKIDQGLNCARVKTALPRFELTSLEDGLALTYHRVRARRAGHSVEAPR